MARQKKDVDGGENVVDYRHKNVTRLNIPPAGLTARGPIVKEKQIKYAYNPHLAPTLRFDATGKADNIAELVEAAGKRRLEPDEIALLQEAWRNYEPWLEWAGKREQQWCVADPVALHIHERISTQAILRVAKRENIQRNLFADPEQEYREAVQFYKHSMDWTNRMILGDSLAVMASLARREAQAGKVQMIYMDPPYGIKYASNFQPEVGKRDVKDREEDLTREPEMVKAYRDTWTLGVHSYLSYLRDRLLLCKELLADTGSIFVQISDENLHRVRALLDEVFGSTNCCSVVTFFKTTSQTSNLLAPSTDYLLWYAKDVSKVKYRQVYRDKTVETDRAGVYNWLESRDGSRRRMTSTEKFNRTLGEGERIFSLDTMTSQSGGDTTRFAVDFADLKLASGKGFWKTNVEGMSRLLKATRVTPSGITLRYIRYINDFAAYPFSNLWEDTGTGSFTDEKVYVVQTGVKVIERCMFMTTDPGDLVLDPTCGSGTTAYVAEEWGRRWITIDVSRVALGACPSNRAAGARKV